MTEVLPLNNYAYHSEKTVARVIEGELVILNFEIGTNYSANNVGATIWDLCNGQCTIAGVIQAVENLYPEVQTVRRDVADFLADLANEDLIKFSEKPRDSRA